MQHQKIYLNVMDADFGKTEELLMNEQKVVGIVRKFIEDNKIHSAETIYQCDWVAEKALEFIEELCDEVGYKKFEEDDI